MDILEEILLQVGPRAAQAVPVDVCIGAHWTFVVMDYQGAICGGIASTLSGGGHDHHRGAGAPVEAAGRLLDYSAHELASMATHDSLLEASVGLATINALLDVDDSRCVEVNAADVVAERGAGRRVALVGHFPFVPQLREVAAPLWVLELHPGAGDLPAAMAPEILPQADVVALTGTSLLNRTFDELIGLCRPDAYVLVLGATTPLSSAFFKVGVDAVSGTWIVDPRKAMLAVGQGATFRQIPGKRLLTMFRDRFSDPAR